MRIIFFGTPRFAVPTLDHLIASRHDVEAAVTQPDRKSGRGRKPAYSPVKIRARQAGIRVVQISSLLDAAFLRDMQARRPAVFVIVAFGQLLPKEVLAVPALGCINVHASLLPRYRGAAPINWAIMRGEEKTGITTMLMDEGMDTGPVLLQTEVTIREGDTAGSLTERLAEVGAGTLAETLELLEAGALNPRPQSGAPSYAPSLKKSDGLISWSRPAEELSCFIRGTNPWPGAYTFLNRERIKILRAIPRTGTGEAGTVYRIAKNELLVGTGSGLLSVLELQKPGRPAVGIQAFLQGSRFAEGMRFRDEPEN